MKSSKFCGCKAIDYCNILSDSICLAINGKDLESTLIGYDQIFRRSLNYASSQPKKKINLKFLVRTSEMDSNDKAGINAHLRNYLETIWKEDPLQVWFLTLNLDYVT